MASVKVTRATSFNKTIYLNGDKSISHRVLMVSALKKQKTKIVGLSEAADPMSTKSILVQLGVDIRKKDDHWIVNGVGRNGFKPYSGILDVGNSGTTIRLMSGILAAQPFKSELTGDASIRKRPMGRIIRPLEKMGGNIKGTDEGKAPIIIIGSQRLSAIDYDMDIASAQVKSCVLLAGLYTKNPTRVIEHVQTRDHTERLLNLKVTKENGNIISESSADHDFELGDLNVPGDTSSAAFWAVAACIVPNSYVIIENVCLNPTRTGFIEVLKQMGADIKINQTGESQREPYGTIEVKTSHLKGVTLSGEIIANIIDEIPILSVAGCFAEGTTEIRGAKELRVKESDRISAIVKNIRSMGGEAEEFEDGLKITGGKPLKGADIDTFHDHRIAMCFAVAALAAEGETTILHSESASISYPKFWETLQG